MTDRGTTGRCPTCGSDVRDMPEVGYITTLGWMNSDQGTEVCRDPWHDDAASLSAPSAPQPEPVRELVEALRLTIPFLFEHGAHVNPHCYRGSDDGCYCGLAEAKAEVERVLARYQK